MPAPRCKVHPPRRVHRHIPSRPRHSSGHHVLILRRNVRQDRDRHVQPTGQAGRLHANRRATCAPVHHEEMGVVRRHVGHGAARSSRYWRQHNHEPCRVQLESTEASARLKVQHRQLLRRAVPKSNMLSGHQSNQRDGHSCGVLCIAQVSSFIHRQLCINEHGAVVPQLLSDRLSISKDELDPLRLRMLSVRDRVHVCSEEAIGRRDQV